jgi:hypothetical protein
MKPEGPTQAIAADAAFSDPIENHSGGDSVAPGQFADRHKRTSLHRGLRLFFNPACGTLLNALLLHELHYFLGFTAQWFS